MVHRSLSIREFDLDSLDVEYFLKLESFFWHLDVFIYRSVFELHVFVLIKSDLSLARGRRLSESRVAHCLTLWHHRLLTLRHHWLLSLWHYRLLALRHDRLLALGHYRLLALRHDRLLALRHCWLLTLRHHRLLSLRHHWLLSLWHHWLLSLRCQRLLSCHVLAFSCHRLLG